MKKVLICLTLLLFVSAPAFAGSVDTFGIGAKATSLGGAVGASVDDVFSVYYNPAGLSKLDGPTTSVGIQMLDPDLKADDYTVSGGNYVQEALDVSTGPLGNGGALATSNNLGEVSPTSFSDKSDNLFVPTLGYAQPITDNISVGVAAYLPFGLDVKWSDNPTDNPGADNVYHSYYMREVISPTVSYKLNDQWSFGFGVSLGKSKAGDKMRLNYPVAPTDVFGAGAGVVSDTYDPAVAAGLAGVSAAAAELYTGLALTHAVDNGYVEVELEDKFNYSLNFGAMYNPNDIFAIGLTFRGRAEADFEGDIKINGVEHTDIEQDYDHPEQVQIGVQVKPLDNLSLEMDVVWTRWSINDEQKTTFDQPLLGLLPSKTSRRDWNNTNQVRLGLEWQYNEMVALRTGYFYDPSPIPDDTFDMMWPDGDRKTYSAGVGLAFGNFEVDASLQYAIAETKRIIGGESYNLNTSYNPQSVVENNKVSVEAGGSLIGYGVTVTYNF
jgi:long-chain fatty acid transport protein